MDRLRHRAAYWKSKCGDLKSSCDDEVVDAVIIEKEAQAKFSDEIDVLEYEKLWKN